MRTDIDQPASGEAPAPRPVKKNYTRPLDIKHGRVDMGHGAGGKAAAQLINTVPGGFRQPAPAPRRRRRGAFTAHLPHRRGPARGGHRWPRGLAAVLSGWRRRLPLGARHGQRRGHVGRQAAVAERELHPRRRFSADRPAAHRALHGRRRPRGRRAHRHRRHQGGGKGQGDGVFVQHRGMAWWRHRAWTSPGTMRARRRCCCSRAPSAITVWPCFRSASRWPSRPPLPLFLRRAAHPGGDRRWPAARRGAGAAGPRARRPGHPTAQTGSPGSRVWALFATGGRHPVVQVDAACELLGLDPLYVAQRRQAGGGVCARAPTPCWPPLRAHAGGPTRRASARSPRPAPLRADGHAIRRPARGGLAQRRATAHVC